MKCLFWLCHWKSHRKGSCPQIIVLVGYWDHCIYSTNTNHLHQSKALRLAISQKSTKCLWQTKLVWQRCKSQQFVFWFEWTSFVFLYIRLHCALLCRWLTSGNQHLKDNGSRLAQLWEVILWPSDAVSRKELLVWPRNGRPDHLLCPPSTEMYVLRLILFSPNIPSYWRGMSIVCQTRSNKIM